MRALYELSDSVACLAIVQEDLKVGTDAGKVISRGRILDILDEFGVRLNGLRQKFSQSLVKSLF